MIAFASFFRQNFFATRAVSPPVEAEPATKSVIVAIHAGHILFRSIETRLDVVLRLLG
jgi:hypothetical protein